MTRARADTVLILCERNEGALGEVIHKCAQRGFLTSILEHRAFVEQGTAALRFGQGAVEGNLVIAGKEISLDRIRAVWVKGWWRGRWPLQEFPFDVPSEVQRFIINEWEQLIAGLWESLSHCYWVSPPANIKAASYRPSAT